MILAGFCLVAGLAAILFFMLATQWRRRFQGTLLIAMVASVFFWALYIIIQSLFTPSFLYVSDLVEFLKNFFVIIFLSRLLQSFEDQSLIEQALSDALSKLAYGVALLLMVMYMLGLVFPNLIPPVMSISIAWGGLLTALLVLALSVMVAWSGRRQQYSNAFWFLSAAFSAQSLFDLIFFSNQILQQDTGLLWIIRAMLAIVVLLVIFQVVQRMRETRLAVYISRAFLNYFIVAGALSTYLLLAAFSAQLLQLSQGMQDGRQFFSLSVGFGFIIIIVLVLSRPVHERFKVYLDKHFREFKYEYREEWLRLIRQLSREDGDLSLDERAIRALADIVDSSGGNLWVRVNKYQFHPIAQLNIPQIESVTESTNSAFCEFIELREWVFNLDEYFERPDLYGRLALPGWLRQMPNAWLIVPLMLHRRLYGFIVLIRPNRKRDFNWEDIDLLRTAGRQVAIHLSESRSTLALLEARQFEAFNRLSAYVVHDLKNVISQLDLVVRNAKKHRDNPEFVDDAFHTVDNAVQRMQRLLVHLKGERQEAVSRVMQRVELGNLLDQLVRERRNVHPVPEVIEAEPFLWTEIDAEKLLKVLGHLVQNAQEATPANGYVHLSVRREGAQARISIEDNGNGMDAEFIRERLFKPFDSTKGLTGMGIGAHEAREFIEHVAGGRIEVESEVNRGTIFKVWVPLVDQA